MNFYLGLGYVPGDLCIAQGVKKLPPGHFAKLSLRRYSLDVCRYWELPNSKASQYDNLVQLTDQLELLFRNSVKSRLIADVPVGVLLSGGVDSSLVAAIAAEESSRPVKTFTITFPNKGKYDESKFARIIANRYQTEHHELPAAAVSPLELFRDIEPYIDEPIADSSLLPSYLLSHHVRKYVKTAMGGDGGDELFGGYPRYQRAIRMDRLTGVIPTPLLRTLSVISRQLPVGVKGRDLISSLKNGAWGMHIWGTTYFDYTTRKRLLENGEAGKILSDYTEPEAWLESLAPEADGANAMMRQDIRSYLPDDIMAKVDRASMINSLEIRAPWLDHRLIEWSQKNVPVNYKVTASGRRILQTHLAKRILPRELDLNRKQGFSIPLDSYLRGYTWNSIAPYLQSLEQVVNMDIVRKVWVGHQKGRANGARIFSLLMLAASISNLQ
jgi:asparagine synthase (glutamine-hydrolysing)